MNNYTEKLITPCEPEYAKQFWNLMRGHNDDFGTLRMGQKYDGSIELPTFNARKCEEALKATSLFRQMATCAYAAGSANWLAVKDSEDQAAWVSAGGQIPITDGMEDFQNLRINFNKLAALVKLNESFVYDVTFDIEKSLTRRMARTFAKGEDDAFINGTGEEMPTGILCSKGGADVGVTTAALTYDDVIGMFFSLRPEYREHGVWLMNDRTALALRTMKDAGGNYLWNSMSDTILGKKVYICNQMPDATSGNKPIAFGDFSYYWIVDRAPISITVLQELFDADQQIGYLGYEYLDARLLRTEAIQVIQMTK